MNTVSEFSFKCRDGIHKYIYNPNARISSFLLFKQGFLVHREDYFCSNEEYHIRRVLYDFNYNCIHLPGRSIKYKVRIQITNILMVLVSWFMVFVFGIIYIFLMCVIKIMEIKYASKKRKSDKSTSI